MDARGGPRLLVEPSSDGFKLGLTDIVPRARTVPSITGLRIHEAQHRLHISVALGRPRLIQTRAHLVRTFPPGLRGHGGTRAAPVAPHRYPRLRFLSP